jgi:ADP-ribose pyrophosphatase YjhB (NUDIX family)
MAGNSCIFCPKCGHKIHDNKEDFIICSSCYSGIQFGVMAVVCILLQYKEKILLLKRRYPPSELKYAFPGGYIMNHELPDKSIKREIFEELGIFVSEPLYLFRMITEKNKLLISYRGFVSKQELNSIKLADESIDLKMVDTNSFNKIPIAFESTKKLLEIAFSQIDAVKTIRGKVFAIDLDGVIFYKEKYINDNTMSNICSYTKYILSILKKNNKIVVYTARKEVDELKYYLIEQGIDYDYINYDPDRQFKSTKILADFYIDDKAITSDHNLFKALLEYENRRNI